VNRVKALAFPTLIVLELIMVPRMALAMVPEGVLSAAKSIGLIDPWQVLDALLIFGVFLATLSVLVNLTEKWSGINLASSIISALSWFGLSLYLWGLGDPWALGLVTRTLNVMRNAKASFVLDMRFFVAFLAGISVLKVIVTALEFIRTRRIRGEEAPAS
jgi:hypothetical protein